LTTIKSDTNSVERSGAAQALSQVLASLDMSLFIDLLPQFLHNANHSLVHVREGALGMFVFLPAAFGQRLSPFLAQIMPMILQGIADEIESVRDVAIRAGQAVVNQFGSAQLSTLLPALEDGFFHDNWRIRQNSVELMGDLLMRVSDQTSGEGDAQETSVSFSKAGQVSAVLLSALGEERYRSILASLYMVRSDNNPVVRQRALLVWKSVVQNTQKTLKEILPYLTSKVILCLASSNRDKRAVAGKTFGELVDKLGDQILSASMPVLKSNLRSGDSSTQQGVCLAVRAVLQTAPRHSITKFWDDLLGIIRTAMCDSDTEVREVSGEAFDELFKVYGARALSDILPPLLSQLQHRDQEISNRALLGLSQLLEVRASAILPHLLPQLLKVYICCKKARESKREQERARERESKRARARRLTTLADMIVIVEPSCFDVGCQDCWSSTVPTF
jgi:hypothetical protein